MSDILCVCCFAFLAGLLDAVVGGGGLIQLPALLIFYPKTDLATLFGTNKLSSIAGTSVAVWRYSLHVRLDWKTILPAALSAFVFSFLGARAVIFLSTANLRPWILALLIVVAVYTFVRKDFGSLHAPHLTPRKQLALGLFVGAGLGFYDGFFGPGTGSFLIFAFIGLFGFDFLNATASAKVLNAATNLGAILCFAPSGRILYSVALPMAAANVAGSLVGTRLAILKGSRFVRVLFLSVVSAIILKLVYDSFINPGINSGIKSGN